jgi:hypothetical protein
MYCCVIILKMIVHCSNHGVIRSIHISGDIPELVASICVTDNHGCSVCHSYNIFFPLSWLITGFMRVSLAEKDLLTIWGTRVHLQF